jgi:predicted nucleic acid-binding protein
MPSAQAVIDASIALKLVLPDALQEQCRSLVARLLVANVEIVAPDLWAYETTSTVCKAIHFKQLTADEGRQIIVRLNTLGVRLIPPDTIQNQQAFEWTVRLKRGAAYDSYYLALAEALGCELWTADRRFYNAVNLPWVRWVTDSESDSGSGTSA